MRDRNEWFKEAKGALREGTFQSEGRARAFPDQAQRDERDVPRLRDV